MRQPGLCAQPHPMCYGTHSQTETCNSLNHMMVTNCAVCLKPFPIQDIIVGSCRHLYHPWCALSHFRVNQTCAAVDCPAVMSAAWQKSFGFNEVDLTAFATEELDTTEESRISEIARRQEIALANCPEVGECRNYTQTLCATIFL